MRHRKWLTAIAIVTFGTIPAFPQTQTGVLQVSVKVPGTLAPIPGAQVSLLPRWTLSTDVLDLPENEEDLMLYLAQLAIARGIHLDDLSIHMGHSSNSPLSGAAAICSSVSSTPVTAAPAEGVTDGNGNAVVRDLAPGRYNVSARRDGYARPLPSGSLSIQAPATAWTTVVVDAGGTPAEVSLLLNPTVAIGGRILDSKGDPITNACVLLGVVKRENGRTMFMPGAHTLTDARGEYRVQSQKPGVYAVRVQRSPSSPVFLYFPGTAQPEDAQLVSVKADSDTLGIDLDFP